MIVYNYTRVRKRDKRVYTLFDYTLSKSGWAMATIKTSAFVLSLFTIFGLLFCYITGVFWYNPLSLVETSFAGYFYIVFVFIPITIGSILSNTKIQNYRAIDYLIIYFIPRIPLDQNGKRIKIEGYKINTFIERI